MKLITQRSQIRSVAERWLEQISRYGSKAGRHSERYQRLLALDAETATPADVEAIIGNGSWCGPVLCDECGDEFNTVVRVGQEPDTDSNTVTLCLPCTKLALGLFGEAE